MYLFCFVYCRILPKSLWSVNTRSWMRITSRVSWRKPAGQIMTHRRSRTYCASCNHLSGPGREGRKSTIHLPHQSWEVTQCKPEDDATPIHASPEPIPVSQGGPSLCHPMKHLIHIRSLLYIFKKNYLLSFNKCYMGIWLHKHMLIGSV